MNIKSNVDLWKAQVKPCFIFFYERSTGRSEEFSGTIFLHWGYSDFPEVFDGFSSVPEVLEV